MPYNFGGRTMSADETLAKTVQLGVSAVEMRSQPIELAMGAPAAVIAGGRGDIGKAAAASLREWRLKTDPKKAAEVRKKYDDAGVKIEVVKYDGIYEFSDAGDGLRLRAGEGGGRESDLVRAGLDRPGSEARRSLRRQAQGDGRLPRPRI